MLAMWWREQPLGQPLTLTCRDLMAGSSTPWLRMLLRSASATPIEEVMPILQLSVPGQATTSVMEFAPSSARPVALSAAHTSNR